MWYYQYDALGRRISKACPQQQLKITYLWDGDQLAYTQTVKQDKLISQRHSVFHGWQLIAQQDCYQQSQQTLDGNKTEWKHETHYAITQPNGKVLGLLSPEGKLKWKDEKRSVWGLLFPNDYRKTSPLDPQLLFAGQYSDPESGLAYNRFRYYEPESGNYISSDPIGLNGGEQPYRYVHNVLDFADYFGLTTCWTKKGRIKDAGLPTKGKIRYIPPKNWQPSMPLPRKNGGYIDKFGNVWTKGPPRTAGEAFEWDVQLSKIGKENIGWLTRDGSHANVSLLGRITHR
ncbi:polymorphic toxin type 17 domain-containing protein [Pasteurella sp. PK-2025]|uniref:polymorphic toxin type 17 domain-containing protein n=1 Tax=Pasteurella sp. PK-2025 TaxID=3413133 RepID=UPI003C734A61